MSGQFWLSDKQVERLRPNVPKPPGQAARGRSESLEWDPVHPAQWPALPGCSDRLRTAQDAL
jgi:hypothetical protein